MSSTEDLTADAAGSPGSRARRPLFFVHSVFLPRLVYKPAGLTVNRWRTARRRPWETDLPDRGTTACSSDLTKLGEDIRALLARSDALGLPYVAIHLCNALESLESEPALGDLPIDPGSEGSLPG